MMGHETGKNSLAGAFRGIKVDQNNTAVSQSVFYNNSRNGRTKKRYTASGANPRNFSSMPFSVTNRTPNDFSKAQHR